MQCGKIMEIVVLGIARKDVCTGVGLPAIMKPKVVENK
jgi:hypothetical protein